jgi:hypothetical protein
MDNLILYYGFARPIFKILFSTLVFSNGPSSGSLILSLVLLSPDGGGEEGCSVVLVET